MILLLVLGILLNIFIWIGIALELLDLDKNIDKLIEIKFRR